MTSGPPVLSRKAAFMIVLNLGNRNAESLYQLLDFPAKKCKRRNDEEQILHARGIIIRFDHRARREWSMLHVFGERERNLPGRRKDAGAENLRFAVFFDQAK